MRTFWAWCLVVILIGAGLFSVGSLFAYSFFDHRFWAPIQEAIDPRNLGVFAFHMLGIVCLICGAAGVVELVTRSYE